MANRVMQHVVTTHLRASDGSAAVCCTSVPCPT
jgi:hypothetical protein